MPRLRSLRTAVAEIQERIDEGEDGDNLEMIVLPPDQVDGLSDEEDIDDNTTSYGTDQYPQDTVGCLEAGVRNTPDEAASQPKAKSQKKRKWRKRVSYDNPIKDEPLEQLYREHPELCLLSPFEIFMRYFDVSVSDLIIQQSELYAHRDKNNPQFTLERVSLWKFTGTVILSGYHRLPQEKLYWSKDSDVGVDIVREALTKNEFVTIKKYIHLADNEQLDRNDKMAKVTPLIEKLNANLMQFGVFSKNLSVDEQMVPYFGPHSCKMTIRNKPIRFGYKLWVIAGDGYPFKVEIYTGKSSNAGAAQQPLGTRVVLSMIDVVENPSRHTLSIDNLFTSLELLRTLSERKLRTTGIIRSNRLRDCPVKDDKTVKKQVRGASDHYCDGEVCNRLSSTWTETIILILK